MVLSSRKLSSGRLELPSLGFGAAALGGLFSSVDKATAEKTLQSALRAGLRYVDTAPFYGFGRSERVVGDVLRQQNYVLSTKVGRLLEPGALSDPGAEGWPDALPFHPVFDYSYDGIMRSVEHSLHRLGLDRIDILYVHDIGEETHGKDNARLFGDLKSGGYKALDKLRADGTVKAIGLGVNEVEICHDALRIGDWDLFLLAGRYTLLEQTALDTLMPECVATETSIVVGGPFNSGILVGGDTWNYGIAPDVILQKVSALRAVSDDFSVPLAAAALQFPMGHPQVISVIPGLRSVEELNATLAWAEHSIPTEYWQALKDRGLIDGDTPTPGANPFLER